MHAVQDRGGNDGRRETKKEQGAGTPCTPRTRAGTKPPARKTSIGTEFDIYSRGATCLATLAARSARGVGPWLVNAEEVPAAFFGWSPPGKD